MWLLSVRNKTCMAFSFFCVWVWADLNSIIFHRVTIDRRRENRVLVVSIEDGNEVENDSGIKDVLVNYFEARWSASDVAINGELPSFQNILYSDNAQHLSRPVIVKEVMDAARKLPVRKAFGPNGLSAMFYKAYWNIVADDVCCGDDCLRE